MRQLLIKEITNTKSAATNLQQSLLSTLIIILCVPLSHPPVCACIFVFTSAFPLTCAFACLCFFFLSMNDWSKGPYVYISVCPYIRLTLRSLNIAIVKTVYCSSTCLCLFLFTSAFSFACAMARIFMLLVCLFVYIAWQFPLVCRGKSSCNKTLWHFD